VQRDRHSKPAPEAPEPRAATALKEASYGDRVARLFREHNDSLMRALRARLSSPQEATEVAQEAYVRLLRLDNPGAVSFLQAYLFKTAINLANDRLKHKARKAHLDPLVFFDSDTEAVSPPPDRGVCAQQELDLIERAVESLPAKCRQAFLLHRVYELSVEETAERTRLNPRVVRRYVARALAHCQKALEDRGSVSGEGT